MMYPARISVDTGNLVLGHSNPIKTYPFPNFYRILSAVFCSQMEIHLPYNISINTKFKPTPISNHPYYPHGTANQNQNTKKIKIRIYIFYSLYTNECHAVGEAQPA